jgi:riboflavin synthase
MRYILPKGFIGLDGASLTVASTNPAGTFSVWLIPETLQRTCFSQRAIGATVNLEIDAKTQAIVDTVERYMEARN